MRHVEPGGRAAILLGLRLLYGWQFAQTGWGKISHLGRTAGFFAGLGLPAPRATALLVGVVELAGGVLLAAGAQTRQAAALLTIDLVTALLTAHADEAFSSPQSFTEQAPFPLLVATLVLLAFGAGWLSVDGWRQAPGAGRTAGGDRSRSARRLRLAKRQRSC